ncbi:hypothetical protein GOODEAATRI_001542 [Goodea atripinnis]|uniref:Uncharacterized protein n=1 Tax=Goodea atripinnis TaxID=208336 RepID=A0ABV0PK25_9TELE
MKAVFSIRHRYNQRDLAEDSQCWLQSFSSLNPKLRESLDVGQSFLYHFYHSGSQGSWCLSPAVYGREAGYPLERCHMKSLHTGITESEFNAGTLWKKTGNRHNIGCL